MDEPKSLNSLFKEKMFRIPDYQRGYAWRKEQLKDFWEDLINLSDGRSHYTGVLTLKQIPDEKIDEKDKEFWLVDDHSFHLYHVVDGQQRLTTFIVFLQAFVDYVINLPENINKSTEEIYISESMNIAAIKNRFLFRTKPTGDKFRTYLFGYESDNPSYKYLKHEILNEPGGGSIDETFYTLNLGNAKRYFFEQINELHKSEGDDVLKEIYRKLTRNFLFNEYIIKDEFDVFVAFETMNNRGKKLSDLELLKNRLIYLTTLYSDSELDPAERKSLRETINEAWKGVYHQLGRNKKHPLNDDDFLQAHWIMYFRYTRKTGRDYIRFLLDEKFTPQKIHTKIGLEVSIDDPEEIRSSNDDMEIENGFDDKDENILYEVAQLSPLEIRDYALSLKESSVHWFNSFFPDLADGLTSQEKMWLTKLNRIGISYFRPLVMAVLKNFDNETERIRVLKKIEQFIFLIFRLNYVRSNYGSSNFYRAARQIDQENANAQSVISQLDEFMAYAFDSDGTFRVNGFYNYLYKLFKSGDGYYRWSGLRYFLFEYESSLLSESRQQKLSWEDFLKTKKDKVSIEHIYPQTETEEWAKCFSDINQEQKKLYSASLGNLLLLSMSINSSLQNDSFQEKKNVKYDEFGEKIRNGYSDGSHSEIEVSNFENWGPIQIKERGKILIRFMESRWRIKFKDTDREILLFLDNTQHEI